MDSQQTIRNWVDHLANGCCHIYMRHEKHDLDFTQFVIVETLDQLSQKFNGLPADFQEQVDQLKKDFLDDRRVVAFRPPRESVDWFPGRVLQILRSERQMSVEELSVVLDCPASHTAKILAAEYPMTQTQIAAAAKRFSVSPAVFCRDVDHPTNEGDFIVRASQEFQLLEILETLSLEEIDCLIDCSLAIVKLQQAICVE